MPVVVDATHFISLVNKADRHHRRAKQNQERLGEKRKLYTTLLVLGEVSAVLGPSLGGKLTKRILDGIRTDVSVLHPGPPELDDAMGLFLKYDGKLSLSDALLLVYAQRLDAAVLSYDADFEGKADLF